MASINRRPLAARPPQSLMPSPVQHLKPAHLAKRPRSPDSAAHSLGTLIKRLKPTTATLHPSANKDVSKDRKPDHTKVVRDHQRAEREQQRLEFKEKYCRAFPNWTFYLDTDNMENDHDQVASLKSKILQLGAKIEHFFSVNVTHLISNGLIPGQPDSEKENLSKGRIPPKLIFSSKSPAKLRTRQAEEQETNELINKALKFNMKIWNTIKLESVLSRCLQEPQIAMVPAVSGSKQRNPTTLSKLLQSERINGLSERDPTQKRHDFRYFTRNSYFILIEDMRGELATIAAHEYPYFKERDGEKPPWPTLYCHPHARGPFIPFDEREKKRWERLLLAEKKENEERKMRCEVLLKEQLVQNQMIPRPVRKAGDLRRCVSMNNMKRNANIFSNIMADHDGEGEAIDSPNASGHLASGLMGYMAASGNSVGITSTTGTTSTANYTSRNPQVPSSLTGRMRLEVVMRKQPQEKLTRANTMGPPTDLPPRALVLRKSKSTNTLKLPKREEGSKPGYCESCRQKFEDFKEHIQTRKHRKFAEDDNNFLQLDYILERVQRRTLVERQTMEQGQLDICQRISGQDFGYEAEPRLIQK